MARTSPPPLSANTREALAALGASLRAARLQRRMSQAELGSRVGTSRFTVMAIERGDATVAIGTALEAAAVLGLSLLMGEARPVPVETARRLLEVLPARGLRKAVKVRDDF